MQTELRRVGCLTAAADGDWNAASQRSMALFNRYAGTKFDVKLASLDALDAIKLKPSRVCPLVCEHGFKADGDRCSKIACAEGSFLNDDNECEKRRAKKPAARRDDDRASRRAKRLARKPALPSRDPPAGRSYATASAAVRSSPVATSSSGPPRRAALMKAAAVTCRFAAERHSGSMRSLSSGHASR